MEIQHEEKGSKGAFFVKEKDVRLAEMTYSLTNNSIMIIDHTEVDDVLRGKSVGAQMVKAAVEFARKNQLKIIPLCPFAKSVFDKKKEEYQDVLN